MAIFFKDASNGWAVGFNGLIIHTTDGGVTWETQICPVTEAQVYDVYFMDLVKGWVVGKGGLILKTTDSGSTWEQQVSDTDQDLDNITFSDSLNGWITSRFLILHSDDGGETWESTTTGYYILSRLYFTDPFNGWAVGMSGNIIHTSNGGDNWQLQSSGSVHNWFADVFFYDSKHGWAAGQNGTVMHTGDGGMTWDPQESGTATNLNSVVFTDSMTGYCAGDNGTLIFTRDGGTTWDLFAGLPDENLRGMDFIDSMNGRIVGYDGTILHTSDGAQTWSSQLSSTDARLNDVCFTDKNNGWICGYQGTLLHTSNGGDTWVQQSGIETSCYFRHIFFTDADHGWVTGTDQMAWDSDVLLRTTNGGETWEPPLYPLVNAIFFIDSLTGWGGTSFGPIMGTTDGGITWTLQTGQLFDNILSFYFTDYYHGWAVGCNYNNDGIILFTNMGGAAGLDEPKPVSRLSSSAKPNPFHRTTEISFTLQAPGPVQIAIYDLAGKKLEELSNAFEQAGPHSVLWHAEKVQTGDLFLPDKGRGAGGGGKDDTDGVAEGNDWARVDFPFSMFEVVYRTSNVEHLISPHHPSPFTLGLPGMKSFK